MTRPDPFARLFRDLVSDFLGEPAGPERPDRPRNPFSTLSDLGALVDLAAVLGPDGRRPVRDVTSVLDLFTALRTNGAAADAERPADPAGAPKSKSGVWGEAADSVTSPAAAAQPTDTDRVRATGTGAVPGAVPDVAVMTLGDLAAAHLGRVVTVESPAVTLSGVLAGVTHTHTGTGPSTRVQIGGAVLRKDDTPIGAADPASPVEVQLSSTTRCLIG